MLEKEQGLCHRGISLRRINLVVHCVRLSAKYLPVSEKFPHETARLERLEGFALVAIFAGGPKNDRLVSAAGETQETMSPQMIPAAPGGVGSRIAYRSASSVGHRSKVRSFAVAGYDLVYGILRADVFPK